MVTATVKGYFLSLSLIVAIGSQNAFILRQGLHRSHVSIVVAICILCDVLLFSLGALGGGAMVEGKSLFADAIRILAVGFLGAYGMVALRSALRGGGSLDAANETRGGGRLSVALGALAVTLLNPHVYLDTVVLFGGLASGHDFGYRAALVAGAVAGSATWLAGLGFGAAKLQPLMRSPRVWQILDAGIAVVMWSIAGMLVVEFLTQ
ncbi:LysE family transporter [Salinisphaera sp. USBA-960]|nr:LysE family transporter [Salifodinibacter halophilus]NNC26227.1 LysE family transporter [Salifodinibacter halophilus]